MTPTKFLEYLNNRQLRDFTKRLDDLRVVSPETLLIQGEDQEYEITTWAFSQLCTRLDIPTSYMRRCPVLLVRANMNYWIQKGEMRDKPVFIRTIAPDTCRAILSSRYSPIDDDHIIEAASESMKDYSLSYVVWDGRRTKFFYSDNDDNREIKAGVHIYNSEIGMSSLVISAAILMHDYIISSVNIMAKRKHVGDANILNEKLQEFLKEYEGFANKADAAVKLAQVAKVDEDAIPVLLKKLEQIMGKTFIEAHRNDVVEVAQKSPAMVLVEKLMDLTKDKKLDPQQEQRMSRLAGALMGI